MVQGRYHNSLLEISTEKLLSGSVNEVFEGEKNKYFSWVLKWKFLVIQPLQSVLLGLLVEKKTLFPRLICKTLSFREYVMAISMLIESSAVEKLHWLFKLSQRQMESSPGWKCWRSCRCVRVRDKRALSVLYQMRNQVSILPNYGTDEMVPDAASQSTWCFIFFTGSF